jgi:hypothetical protein
MLTKALTFLSCFSGKAVLPTHFSTLCGLAMLETVKDLADV